MASNVNGLSDDQQIREYKDLDPSVQELINHAIEIRKRAYCPYSNFPVGAAVRTASGEIFTGCNIENSSFSATICAERAAIAKAVSEGHRNLVACAVVAYKEDSFVYPCGVCRQVLAEFTDSNGNTQIYLAKPSSSPLRILCTTVRQIIPFIFKLETLSRGVSSSEHGQSLHLND